MKWNEHSFRNIYWLKSNNNSNSNNNRKKTDMSSLSSSSYRINFTKTTSRKKKNEHSFCFSLGFLVLLLLLLHFISCSFTSPCAIAIYILFVQPLFRLHTCIGKMAKDTHIIERALFRFNHCANVRKILWKLLL